MIKKLTKLLENSYSPYSNVKVSAVVVDKNNNEYSGVNIENAVFGVTICAERSALFNAISNGVKIGEINELHLFSSLDKRLFPCGSCRQVMNELMDKDAKVYIYDKTSVEVRTVSELFPDFVGKESF